MNAANDSTNITKNDVRDCLVQISALTESCKAMIISAEGDDDGGKCNAHALTLACMISEQVDRAADLVDSLRLKGGAV